LAPADFPTLAQAGRLIRDKALSPVELTRMCLDRVERFDGDIHAFIRLDADEALAAARAAEAEIMRQGPRGPLHGIPVGLKDVFHSKGTMTSGHSWQMAGHEAAHDAAVVERLSAAGAIMMGKMTAHEFAFGGPSFDLPWPPSRNPWNLAHFTGGSSSGSAAGIAAGMVLGSIGTDTSGSVRSPAALCGITGLKPTYGRVSRHGSLPLAFSLDHVGTMAWNAEDCALLLQAVAGHDSRDPACAPHAVPDYTADIEGSLAGLRVGVIRQFFENDFPVSATTVGAIDGALAVLRELGAQVDTVSLSPLADWGAAGFLILLAEGHAVHEEWLKHRPEKYGESMRDRIALGAFISAADYIQALRRRHELAAELRQAMQQFDIVVTATQPGEAPPIEGMPKWSSFEMPSHCMPFNLAGCPAISVCCGFGNGGMPLAMQLAARPFEEALLLRVAHRYEQATAWRGQRPALRDHSPPSAALL
jgi:aspartyl-tRNA(Asn)/glutamyl-tRNA(Gln) amidotransferase subunit A